MFSKTGFYLGNQLFTTIITILSMILRRECSKMHHIQQLMTVGSQENQWNLLKVIISIIDMIIIVIIVIIVMIMIISATVNIIILIIIITILDIIKVGVFLIMKRGTI